MKRLLLTMFLAFAMTGLTGCYKDLIVIDKGYNPSKRAPDVESGRLYILGFPLGAPVNLNQVCPGGAGLVEVKTYFFINIFAYSSDMVYCKG
jgi:hypothetical protein